MNLDILKERYERELGFLRDEARRFAAAFPAEASRAGLADPENPDPHVDRLIQSVALLAAKLQGLVDERFPELARGLLEVLFPGFLAPLPAMTVVRFEADPEQGRLTERYTVSRGTVLHARARGGTTCRFRTGYDVEVWPIAVEDVRIESPVREMPQRTTGSVVSRMVVTLRNTAPVSVSELGLNRLRFHLGGQRGQRQRLFALLRHHLVLVEAKGGSDGKTVLGHLGRRDLRPCGLRADESLVPDVPLAFRGFRLLLEWFALPEKFLFVELSGLERILGRADGEVLELAFYFSCPADDVGPGGPRTMQIGCTPAINLFSVEAEPIRVDFRREHYPVVPDASRRKEYEACFLEGVRAQDEQGDPVKTVPVQAAFSIPPAERGIAWSLDRRESPSGTHELWLGVRPLGALVDSPGKVVLVPRVLCSNGDLGSTIRVGEDPRGDFFIDGMPGFLRVFALRRPTEVARRRRPAESGWYLLQHLARNYMSIADESGRGIRELLELYEPTGSAAAARQVQAVRAARSRRVDRLVGGSILRGTDLELVVDENAFEGNTSAAFGEVLARVLGMYAPINSFVRLTLRSLQSPDTSWTFPARSGPGAVEDG